MDDTTYALRLPVKPLHWVTGLDSPVEFSIEDQTCFVSAQKPYLILTVKPFETEEDAQKFMLRLWGAFACLAVKHNTGFLMEMYLDKVVYTDDPDKAALNLSKSFGIQINEPVHGLASGNIPAIVPNNKNIKYLTPGEVTVTLSFPQETIIASLEESLKLPNLANIFGDEKLRTAIELLSDSHREISVRSKFLAYVMALEVLAEKVPKHQVVQNLINEFDEMVAKKQQDYHVDSEEYHALESLQRELIFRREASLRSRIRKLVIDNLNNLSMEERRKRAHSVVWAYDIRSHLVHDGKVSNEDMNKSTEIVRVALLEILTGRLGFNFS